MQLVSDQYYIWYNRIATVIGSLLGIAALWAWTIPSLAFLHEQWGFMPITAVIGIVQLIYGFLFFKRQAETNAWAATFFSSMILATVIISIIHNSGQLHSWFMIAWLLQVSMSGMFGLYAVVGSDFIVTLYYVVVATGKAGDKLVDPIAIGGVAGTYLIGALSYFVWKRLYVDRESNRINQLTGQLRNKQQQAEILIQSIVDGIIVTDTEGKISLLNKAAAELTEWPIDEAGGIDVKLVAKFALEDGKDVVDDQNPFKLVLDTNQQVKSVFQLISRNGKQRRVVSLVVSPISIPKSNTLVGSVGVFRDISAERAEEHRRADFISTASHEMRTPVAAIEGYLALALNDKVTRIDSKAREYLVKAHDSTQHLGQLFQDLLTSAKAEDGRLVNHPIVVEMGDFLQKLTDGLKFAAEKKGLLLDFAIGAAGEQNVAVGVNKIVMPLYYAHIDPDRMREVITNLFDNAVKYTDTGKISVGLTGNNEVIQFYIRDTGQGIPADDIPHLFQKFYRVDNSATRTIGGTGLGLFICRKIVELYSGRIWAESEANKGSTFYINLPRLSNQKATEMLTAEKQALGP